MSTSLRSLMVVSALLSGCSQNPGEPAAAGPTGTAGAPAEGGSSSNQPTTSGAGEDDAGGRSNGSAAGSGGASSSTGQDEPGGGGTAAFAGTGGGAGTAHGTVLSTVDWKVIAESQDSTVSSNVPSVASRGKDAAVAYMERPSRRIVLQRFDESGDRLGSPVELGINVDERSNVTLASDGKQYAACWNAAPDVRCSLIDEQNQIHLNALAVSGQYSTIVARANGWALAYSGQDKLVRLQPLTPTLALDGSFIGPVLYTQFSVQDIGPLFAATPSGFALVGSNNEAGDVSLLRVSADLQSVVSATPLGHALWHSAQLVASDTRAAVSLSIPYGSYLLLLDQKKLTAELPIAGGGKTGTDQGLLLTEGGIGAAWLGGNMAVRRRFFADGHDSDVGLDPRTPSNEVLGLEEEGTGAYQQVVQVGNRALLVAKTTRYGSIYGAGAIRVAALNFAE